MRRASADDASGKLALGRDIQGYLQRTVDAEADWRQVDPLAWWRAAAPELPCLAGFARRYLAVPAATAESERVFSLAGAVVSPTRARLSPSRVNELVVTRAFYLKALRMRQGRHELDAADAGERLNDMLDDGALTVDGDGYIDASESAEAVQCVDDAPETRSSESSEGDALDAAASST